MTVSQVLPVVALVTSGVGGPYISARHTLDASVSPSAGTARASASEEVLEVGASVGADADRTSATMPPLS